VLRAAASVRCHMDTVAPPNTQSSTAIESSHIQSLAAWIAPGIADQNMGQRLGTVHASNVGKVLRPFYQGRYASLPFAVQGA